MVHNECQSVRPSVTASIKGAGRQPEKELGLRANIGLTFNKKGQADRPVPKVFLAIAIAIVAAYRKPVA